MSSGPRIEIVVDKKGRSVTTVFGVTGGQCHVVSAPYEALLGDLVSTQTTSEAFEAPQEVEIKSQTS